MSNPRIPYELLTERKLAPWPGGARLLVHVVLNVELWRYDAPMPRKVLPGPHGVELVPDVPNYSWAEYGMRCGLPRILVLLERHGVPASVNLNSGVIDAYPAATEALLRAGLEMVGHGVSQRALANEPDEAAVIAECLDSIERVAGRRPRGWLGPGLQETFATPDVLSAAGVEYVMDWVVDDLPAWLHATPRDLVAVPYSLELNDSVLFAVERHTSAELERRVRDTVAYWDLERDGVRGPRILTLPLHPHLVGVPHRLLYLDRVLAWLCARDDVEFTTGGALCDWFSGARTSL